MTMISRVFGLVRDQTTAWLMGATQSGDLWTVSFMLPNLFRRLIAEGAMSTALVPLFSELDEQEGEAAANQFAKAVFSLILIASVSIVSLMIIGLPWFLPILLGWIQSGAGGQAEGISQALIPPTRLMFPYLIFISLAAICQGVLNVRNRFALPAATPIVLNICIILAGLGLRNTFSHPVYGLAVGVLIGGFLQFYLQWRQLRGLGLTLKPVRHMWTRKTREAVTLWLPTTFSAGIAQINALTGTLVAVSLFGGASTAIFYSNRLMELILGVFVAAVTTAILPLLSKQRGRGDHDALAESVWKGLEVVSLISIPASIGLILAGKGTIALLFQRGEFTEHGVDLTAAALIFHGLALVPISWYRILSQKFYAHKQVKISVYIAAVAAAVNVILCFILPHYFLPGLAHCGVVAATLISSWLMFFLSLHQIRKRFSLPVNRIFCINLLKITLAAAAFIPIWLPFKAAPTAPLLLLFKILLSILIYGALLVILNAGGIRALLKIAKVNPPSP